MLTFYAVRRFIPSIGLVLLAIGVTATGNVGLALLFIVADAAILTLALAIWRGVTLLGPLALGTLVVLNWPRRTRHG